MSELIKISLISFMFTALGEEGQIFHFYQKLIGRLPDWLSAPLGKCYICFTGQVCLWYYIFTQPFDIVEMLFWPSAGIMFAMVFNRIYRLLEV